MVAFGGPSTEKTGGGNIPRPTELAEGFIAAARSGFRPNTYSREIAGLLSAANADYVSSVRRAGAELPAEILGTAIPLIAQLGTLLTGTQRTVFTLELMIGACKDQDSKVSDGQDFEGTLKEIAERHVLKNLQGHSAQAYFQDLSVSPIPPDRKIDSAAIPTFVGGFNFASIH